MKFLVSPNEYIILKPEDWSYDKWVTICEIFGGDPSKTEEIKIPKGTVEMWNS